MPNFRLLNWTKLLPSGTQGAAVPFRTWCASRSLRYLVASALLAGGSFWGAGVLIAAEFADFTVSVGVKDVATDKSSLKPGETTTLRITLGNNSSTTTLTNVGFSELLPVGANGSLEAVGSLEILPVGSGCTGTVDLSDTKTIVVSGFTVPQKSGAEAGPVSCYIDIPVIAKSKTGVKQEGLVYDLTGKISSDQGSNKGDASKSFVVESVGRPTWDKSFEGATPS